MMLGRALAASKAETKVFLCYVLARQVRETGKNEGIVET
jgi:hypothetical protein